MKKQLILCGLAAAAAGISFAAADKLNLVKNDAIIKSIRISSISHLSYHGDEDGFTHLDVTGQDGSVASYSLDGIDHVAYVNGLPDNPVSVELEPHHACATLHVTTSDPNAWYRFSGMPEKSLAGVPEDEWADYLVQDDLDWIYDVSAASGYTLDASFLPRIFEQGDKSRDWFPSEIISDNTPIALVVYTGTITDGEIVLTSEPELIRFTTKKVEDLGVKFNITFDVTSTTLTVKADPYHPEGGDADIPFAIALYSPEQLAENSLSSLVANTLAQYENQVYNYGYTWDDVTFRNHGEKTYTNRRESDQWVAVAFGCEYGVATTDASVEVVTIPEAEVTDDCTFEVEFTQKSGSEGTFTITPSKADTRYAAFVTESERFDGEGAITPSYYLANKVYNINYMNTFQWPTTEYVHTGAAELNSHDDVIDGKYFRAGVEYSLFVCGLDEVGGRTTEIKELRFTTSQKVDEDLTFDIQFANFKADNNYAHYLDITVTPSDPDAKYVLNYHKMTPSYFPETMSDEKFMQNFIDVSGEYLELHSGEFGKQMAFSPEFDINTYEYVFEPYIVYVFGYDGGITTPLYAYLVDTATGEVTPYRLPEKKSLTFELEFSDYRKLGDFYSYHTVTVKPSDPDANYVFNYHKMTKSYFPETMSDETFMQTYVDLSGDNLELHSGDFSKQMAFSSEYSYDDGGWTFGPYIVYVFGYDGGITTPLFAYIVDSGTGEVTPYRIPE